MFIAEVYGPNEAIGYLTIGNGRWALTTKEDHAYVFYWEPDYNDAVAIWNAIRPRGWSRELEFVSVM